MTQNSNIWLIIYFTSFADAIPEIGISETRVLHIIDKDLEVPIGSYGFFECYCTDPECDCQTVHIVVLELDGKEQARISYGWKNKAFLTSDHNFPGLIFFF